MESERAIREGVAAPKTCSTSSPTGFADSVQYWTSSSKVPYRSMRWSAGSPRSTARTARAKVERLDRPGETDDQLVFGDPP